MRLKSRCKHGLQSPEGLTVWLEGSRPRLAHSHATQGPVGSWQEDLSRTSVLAI